MKKAIVILLALALVGGVVFAQDAAAPALALHGYFNIGAVYGDQAADAGSGDATISQNANDAPAVRFNIDGKYAADNYGFAFRLREQDAWTDNNTGAIMVRRAYGWVNLFNKMVKINAGRLGDYAWATGNGGDNNAFGCVDGPVGIQLQLMPTEGLNLGVFVPLTADGGLVADVMQSALIGATYSKEGLGNVQFGIQMKPDVEHAATAASTIQTIYVATGKETVKVGTTYSDFSAAVVVATALVKGNTYIKTVVSAAAAASTDDKNSSMYFGFAYTGMENLTAYVEGKMSYLGDSDSGYTYVYEKFVYVMDAFEFSLCGAQTFFSSSKYKMYMAFNPNVAYTINDKTTGEVGVTYGMTDGNSGYSIDADVKYAVNAQGTVCVGVGYVGGDFAPTLGNIDMFATTYEAAVWANNVTAFVDFVWTF